MGHWHDVAAELAEPTRSLRGAIPDAWGGFAQMHREAMKDGSCRGPSRRSSPW